MLCVPTTAAAAVPERTCRVTLLDDENSALPGATIELIDAEGTVLKTFQSGSEMVDLSSSVLMGGSYTLHQTEAPRGFAMADDVTFHIAEDEDGDPDIIIDAGGAGKTKLGHAIIIKNLRLEGLKVSKRTLGGEELPGAQMTLTDATTLGEVDAWTTEGSAHEISWKELCAGHAYCLTEDVAPTGYQTVAPITFELARDGSVQQLTGDGVTYDEENRTFVVVDSLVPVPEPTPEPEPEPTCKLRVDKSWANEKDTTARPAQITFELIAGLFDANEDRVRYLTTQEMAHLVETAGEQLTKTGKVDVSVAVNGTQEGIVTWQGLPETWEEAGEEYEMRYFALERPAPDGYKCTLVHSSVAEGEQMITVYNTYTPEEHEEPDEPDEPAQSEEPTEPEEPREPEQTGEPEEPVTPVEPTQATVTPQETTPVTELLGDSLPQTGTGSAVTIAVLGLAGMAIALVGMAVRHRH